jgi:hypothetical protein
MEVTLLEPAAGDGAQVQIAGEGISGFALWRGGSGQAPGERVDVELDARGEISWREVVIDPQPTELVGKVSPRALTIRGVVEDLDQNGVITIRVAGGILLLDTAGEAPVGVVGHEVGVIIPQVDVYPTGT